MRIYTIHTTLQIAFARLRALIPIDAQAGSGGQLHFMQESQLDEANQSARITLHLRDFTLQLGRWHVTGVFEHEHSRIFARHAGFMVTIAAPFFALPDLMTSEAFSVSRLEAECTFAQKWRTQRVIKARLPALRKWLSEHIADGDEVGGLVKLRCCMLAETPQSVRVTVCASAALAAMVDEFNRSIIEHWGKGVQDELGARAIALLRDERMSYEAIARELFVSPSTLKRRAKELQARGLVPVRRRGRKRFKS